MLQSLAAGIPRVCSPVAVEGLTLPPRLDGCVANTPQRLADIILKLHEDAAENAACAEAGLAFVGEQFSTARIEEQMSKLLRITKTMPTRRAS